MMSIPGSVASTPMRPRTDECIIAAVEGSAMKSFNTYGPCRPEDHYMLPAAERLPGVRRLIDRKIYGAMAGLTH